MRAGHKLRTSGRILSALLLALALWLALLGLFPRAFQALDDVSGDWLWRISASSASEQRIILIDIDQASLSQLGPWPWSRTRLAELSDRLAEAGVALQVFDLVLAAPAAGDADFAASLARNHGVLAQVFALQPNTQAASGQPAGALPWADCPPHLPVAQGHLANPAAYAGLPVGHITPVIGADGAVRHQPALICHQAQAYPALFIAALGQALQPGATTLQRSASLARPLAPAWQLHGPALGAGGLALNAAGHVRIPWTATPQAFISIPAHDLLAGRAPAELLHNAWVVVGSSALGLNDRVATPFGGNAAGFMVHAQLLRAALDDRLPVEPAHGQLLSALAAALALLPLVALHMALHRHYGNPNTPFAAATSPHGAPPLRRTSVALLPLAALALVLLLWVLKALLLHYGNYWLPWVQAAFFVLLFALALTLVELAHNRHERERLYRHLASYLPAPIAAALVRQEPSDAIEASRATVTVLHADLRNFGAYCEASPAHDTAAVLHAFYGLVTRCVEAQGGRVEAFQGDAVLALWQHPDAAQPGQPAPQQQPAANEPAARALAAACAIVQASAALLPPTAAELAPLAVGIGMESGPATIGSLGLARRRAHLALGRTVTAAARLQEMTAELAHPILLGAGSAALIGPERLHDQGEFLLEGLRIPCRIYAVPLKDCAA